MEKINSLSGSLKRWNEIQDQLGLNVDEIEVVTGLPKQAFVKMWDSCIPKFKEGIKFTGKIVVFGTGGNIERERNDLKELFYSPDSYNTIPFKSKS